MTTPILLDPFQNIVNFSAIKLIITPNVEAVASWTDHSAGGPGGVFATITWEDGVNPTPLSDVFINGFDEKETDDVLQDPGPPAGYGHQRFENNLRRLKVQGFTKGQRLFTLSMNTLDVDAFEIPGSCFIAWVVGFDDYTGDPETDPDHFSTGGKYDWGIGPAFSGGAIQGGRHIGLSGGPLSANFVIAYDTVKIHGVVHPIVYPITGTQPYWAELNIGGVTIQRWDSLPAGTKPPDIP